MKRLPLFAFNIGLALAGATVYAFAVRFQAVTLPALSRAFLDSWGPGLLAGATVGVGATIGPRPALPWKKCVKAQALMAATTLIGGLVALMFPREWSAADQAMERALAQRGIFLGSWIGLAVGTAIQIVQIYLTRRRAARPK